MSNVITSAPVRIVAIPFSGAHGGHVASVKAPEINWRPQVFPDVEINGNGTKWKPGGGFNGLRNRSSMRSESSDGDAEEEMV